MVLISLLQSLVRGCCCGCGVLSVTMSFILSRPPDPSLHLGLDSDFTQRLTMHLNGQDTPIYTLTMHCSLISLAVCAGNPGRVLRPHHPEPAALWTSQSRGPSPAAACVWTRQKQLQPHWAGRVRSRCTSAGSS